MEKLKNTLIGLGLMGVVVVGGIALNLSDDKPVEADCTDKERITVAKEELCLEAEQYSLVKESLEAKYRANGYVEFDDYALYVAIINNEVQKNGSMTLTSVTTENLPEKLNALLKTP